MLRLPPISTLFPYTTLFRSGTGHSAERVGVVKIAVRVIEIRVIEYIKEFSANLEAHGLFDHGPLTDPEVRDADSRAVEELAVGVAKSAVWTTGKCVRQEVGVRSIGTILAGILDHDLPHNVGYIGVPTSNQRVIPALAEPDGQTAGEPSNTVQAPALRQALR